MSRTSVCSQALFSHSKASVFVSPEKQASSKLRGKFQCLTDGSQCDSGLLVSGKGRFLDMLAVMQKWAVLQAWIWRTGCSKCIGIESCGRSVSTVALIFMWSISLSCVRDTWSVVKHVILHSRHNESFPEQVQSLRKRSSIMHYYCAHIFFSFMLSKSHCDPRPFMKSDFCLQKKKEQCAFKRNHVRLSAQV